jgi:tRNA-specific 2-thiouridylase
MPDLGCEVLVTGHHARNVRTDRGWELHRGADRAKDQSYVLSMLTQAELARATFPVGEMTKTEVRAMAAAMSLRTAHKPESMEICFVGRSDYRSFIRGHAPDMLTPGPVRDMAGNQLGSHHGVAGFTIGQRRGLGIATGQPRYVVDIEPSTSTVVIGGRDDLAVTGLRLSGLTGTGESVPQGRVMAQYRAHGEAVPAIIDDLELVFDEPQSAVAPGQTVALYEGDRVLGGAVIAETRR